MHQTSREQSGLRARAGAHCLSLPAQGSSAGGRGAQSPGAQAARTRKQRPAPAIWECMHLPGSTGSEFPNARAVRPHRGLARPSARTCPGARRVCSRALTSSHTGALRSPGKVAPVRALCGERSAAARAGAPEPLPQGPLRGRPKSPGRQPPSAALPPPRQPDYSSQDASGGGAAPPGTLRARGGTGPARAGGGAAGAREVRISARRPQHERGPRTSP